MSKSAKKASPARRPRRYLRSRITRNLILDTAQTVFISEGYAKTTIARISEMANVGYGTVYSLSLIHIFAVVTFFTTRINKTLHLNTSSWAIRNY